MPNMDKELVKYCKILMDNGTTVVGRILAGCTYFSKYICEQTLSGGIVVNIGVNSPDGSEKYVPVNTAELAKELEIIPQ